MSNDLPTPYYRTLPLSAVWRGPGLPEHRHLLWLWLLTLVLSIALGVASVAFEWSGLAVRLGSVTLHLTLYPPLILSTLWTLWLGFWWGFIPAYAATLAVGLYSGMPMGWALVFALADPLGLAILAVAYRTLPFRLDLKSAASRWFYAAVTLMGAIAGSTGAIIWAYTEAQGLHDTFAIWQGWWIGAFLQGLLLNGALLWIAGPAVLRWRERLPGLSPSAPPTLPRTIALLAVCLALLTTFVLSAALLIREVMLRALADGSPDLIGTAADDALLVNLISLALVIFAVALGYTGVTRWTGRLRETVAHQARSLTAFEERHQAIYEQARDGIILIDAGTGLLLDANPAFTAYAARSLETLRAMHVWELRPEASRAQARERFLQIRESNPAVLMEMDLERPDGSRIPIELTSSPVEIEGRACLLSIIRDVSARREAETRLRLFGHALEATTDGITLADPSRPDMPLIYCNDAFYQMTGFEPEEVLGRNCRFLQGPSTDPNKPAAIRAAIEAEEPFRGEILNYRKDGTPFWNDVTITPVYDDQGRLTHFLGIQRDVTERRRLAREVLDVSTRERHRIGRDLHDDLGQLLTGIGFRTAALTQDLQRAGQPERSEAQEITTLVERAIGRTRHMARGLAPVQFDARSLPLALEDLANFAQQHFNLACRCRVQADATLASADAVTHLYRIAQEAVTNAAKHAKASRIGIFLHQNTHGVNLRICDNGQGLPENETREGGMGLRLMKYRAHLIDADLTLSSRTGTGTCVTCRLPAPSEPLTPNPRSPYAGPDSTRR